VATALRDHHVITAWRLVRSVGKTNAPYAAEKSA
jgi:hypothetical protein